MDSVKAKSILIAGGTGGLGQEIAITLGAAGASLMLIHHEENEGAKSLKGKLKQSGIQCTFYACDFTKTDEINDAIDIFFEQQKQPYGLINLLGDPARVDWEKGQIQHMQDSFLRNASAPLHSAKTFGLKLREKSLAGAILLFSSMQGVYPFEGSLYYGTAKAALAYGAKILAKDLGPEIRVNVLAPGVNQAGMALESIRKGKYEKYTQQRIIPHYGTAESIARFVLSLMQPDLYMTGQTILCDGGLTLRRDLLR